MEINYIKFPEKNVRFEKRKARRKSLQTLHCREAKPDSNRKQRGLRQSGQWLRRKPEDVSPRNEDKNKFGKLR